MRRILLTFALVAGSESVFAAPCNDVVSLSSGYITGVGRSDTPVAAKSLAISAALAFFGAKVVTKTTVSEGNSEANLNSATEIDVVGDAKGIVVLDECVEDGVSRVTVGIRKSDVAARLEARAEERLTWLKEQLASLNSNNAGRVRDDLGVKVKMEAADLEMWLLIQRPKEFFKKMPEQDREAIAKSAANAPVSDPTPIAAVGPIAVRTLNQVVSALGRLGYRVAPAAAGSPSSALWSCSLVEGTPMQSAVRFQARCEFKGPGDMVLEPVSVSGIGPSGGIEAAAENLVDRKLEGVVGH